MQSVHQSRNCMCVASCSSLLSWACSHSPVSCCCFSFSSNSSSFFVCLRILTFFQTVQLLLCVTFFTSTALRPWSYMFVCDTRATHCPCNLKTAPVSTCPCVHPAVRVQLDDRAVSIVSHVRIPFIQHHDIANVHGLSY